MLLKNFFSEIKKGLFGNSDHSSKVNARSRLQFVLVQDRAGMSPEEMGKFKKELITVIEKYFNLQKERFDITYKREGDTTTLLINSPVVVRRGSELSKAGFSKQDSNGKHNKKGQALAAN